jgi:hypothetical protein
VDVDWLSVKVTLVTWQGFSRRTPEAHFPVAQISSLMCVVAGGGRVVVFVVVFF